MRHEKVPESFVLDSMNDVKINYHKCFTPRNLNKIAANLLVAFQMNFL